MKAATIASGASKGLSLSRFIKISFFSIFVLYFIFSAVSIGVQEKDVGKTIKLIGKEFYSPLETANERSVEIINNPPKGFFGNFGALFSFYFAVYKIYLWLRGIYWLMSFPLGNSNTPLIISIFTLLVFYVAQIMYFAIFEQGNLNTPFTATVNIFKAIAVISANLNVTPNI